MDVNSAAAITAFVSAGGLGTLLVRAAIVRIRGYNKTDSKKTDGSLKMTLDDRAELKQFIVDTKQRLDRTETRLDAALKRVDDLQHENAQIKAENTVLKADNAFLRQEYSMDRTEWNRERGRMQTRITALELSVNGGQ